MVSCSHLTRNVFVESTSKEGRVFMEEFSFNRIRLISTEVNFMW